MSPRSPLNAAGGGLLFISFLFAGEPFRGRAARGPATRTQKQKKKKEE